MNRAMFFKAAAMLGFGASVLPGQVAADGGEKMVPAEDDLLELQAEEITITYGPEPTDAMASDLTTYPFDREFRTEFEVRTVDGRCYKFVAPRCTMIQR